MPTDCITSLQQTSDLVSAIIWLYDVQHAETIFVSRQLQQQLGHQQHASLPEVVAPEHWPLVQQQLASCTTRSEGPVNNTIRCNLLHIDGSQLPYLLKYNVYEDPAQPGNMLLISAEYIYNKDAEQELAQAKKIIEETEEMLHFGSYERDMETNVSVWSEGLYILLGYEKNTARPTASYESLITHIEPEYRQLFEDTVQTAINERKNTEITYRIKTFSGETKYVTSTIQVTTSPATGSVIKLAGSTRDITSIKLAEEQQALYVHELNRSNKDLEEFAYIASHDLQEPLRKISTFVDRFTGKYGSELNDEGHMYFDRIIASTNNMRALIDNLLDFSRVIQPGHHFTMTDLQETISEVIRDQELIIEETGTIIYCTGLPTLNAVPALLKQLFNNLISNAIKFRRKDVPCTINISAREASGQVITRAGLIPGKKYYQVLLQDNGIGFEEEYADRIFKIFQRLHGKTEYPGTGIGLAVCKKITDHHNGAIFAEGSLEAGAVFSILLPA